MYSQYMETEGERRIVVTWRLKEKDSPHMETERERRTVLAWRLKETDVLS